VTSWEDCSDTEIEGKLASARVLRRDQKSARPGRLKPQKRDIDQRLGLQSCFGMLESNRFKSRCKCAARTATLAAWLLGAWLVAGCLRETRGEPLYAGAPLPKERVARLVGPIVRVDDISVTGGVRTFELLPGCHVVKIGGSIGSFKAAPEAGWVATVPHLFYAFPMRAGHTYSITFEPEPALGMRSVGFGRVVAREEDSSGHRKVVPAARSNADVAECVRLASERIPERPPFP
jgi:hypothetical protein